MSATKPNSERRVSRPRPAPRRRDGAVGGDVKHQAVVVGGLLDPGGLHGESNQADGAEDGVDGDDPDGRGPLVAVGRDITPAPFHGDVAGQAPLGVEGGQVKVGVEDLDIGGRLDVARGDRARARASRRKVTGSSVSTRRTMSLKLRMMSVTSSFTPGSVVNSCRASSKRTWVTAAPGMDDSRVRRRDTPMVWPKPGSRARWRNVDDCLLLRRAVRRQGVG